MTVSTKQLKITQIRSGIGNLASQKRTIKALGFKKMHDAVVCRDTPALRGMLLKVKHLVKVEEVKPRIPPIKTA
jgi:large subunit ribosomal protein L30